MKEIILSATIRRNSKSRCGLVFNTEENLFYLKNIDEDYRYIFISKNPYVLIRQVCLTLQHDSTKYNSDLKAFLEETLNNPATQMILPFLWSGDGK